MFLLNKYRLYNNPNLAEKLIFGNNLDEKEEKIAQNLWKKFDGNRFRFYLYITKLCGRPKNAQSRYIWAMSYICNSTIYAKEAVHYINLYLSHPLYKKYCENNGTFSTSRRTKLHKFEMYKYLAEKYCSLKDYENALKSYQICIDLRPNATISYTQLAKMYAIYLQDYAKSINILESVIPYARKKSNTNNDYIEDFIDIETINCKLDEYKKRLFIKTKYPYRQKQARELIEQKLLCNGINFKLTQLKFKLICEHFNLKENNDYFYHYPDSETYFCSIQLVDLITNSLLKNINLADDIKSTIKK